MTTVSGNSPLTITCPSSAAVRGLTVKGKSRQNGTPTPSAPIKVEGVGTPKRPYKEVLKSITTSGTQYWDTGIVPNGTDKWEFEFRGKFGSVTSSGPECMCGFMGDTANLPRWLFAIWEGEWLASPNITTMSGDADTDEHIFASEIDLSLDAPTGKSYVDGSEIYSGTMLSSSTMIANTLSMYLFARNNDGSTGAYAPSGSQMSYYKIRKNDVLVRDMIPVLDWSGNPCFYDRVSHTMMYHSGTGTLTYERWGMTEVEYIQSSGSQYIDTGINPANKKIGAVLDFQLTSVTSNDQISGSFGSDGVDNWQFSEYSNSGVKWRFKFNNDGFYGDTCDTARHTVRVNMSDGTMIDSTVITSTQYTIASTNTNTIWLGGRNSNTPQPAKSKYYSAQYYGDTELVRDYTPVKISDVAELYDAVNNSLATRVGTFTAGPEVPDEYEITLSKYDAVSSATGHSEQSGTPTPDAPICIESDVYYSISNGVVTPVELRSVGSYTDTYSNGTITRNVGQYVVTGNETGWSAVAAVPGYYYLKPTSSDPSYQYISKIDTSANSGYCNAFTFSVTHSSSMNVNEYTTGVETSLNRVMFKVSTTDFPTLADFKSWLQSLYSAGTPLIIQYPLATPTTETVTLYSKSEITAVLDHQLYNIGDTYDEIELVGEDGTQRIGTHIFDGTETFVSSGILDNCWSWTTKLDSDTSFSDRTVYCNYLDHTDTLPASESRQGYALLGKKTVSSDAGKYVGLGLTTAYPTLAELQAWLASLYEAGNPLIVYYPLTTAESEEIEVTGMPSEFSAGTHILEVDSDLTVGMSVTYGASVYTDANGNEYTVSGTTLYVTKGTSGTGVIPAFSSGSNLRTTLGITETYSQVSMDSTMTTVGNFAFKDDTITAVTMPSVTSVGMQAFYNSSVASLNAPSVTSVGVYAFMMCASLTSVSLPSIVTLGTCAFRDCTALTSVNLGTGITTIADGAFESDTALTSIVIPSSVTSIGDYAFDACTSMTSVKVKGTTPATLGDGAFRSNTASIYVPYSDDHSVLSTYKTAWSAYADQIVESAKAKKKGLLMWIVTKFPTEM